MTPNRALALGRQRYPSGFVPGGELMPQCPLHPDRRNRRREVVRIRRIERMGAKSLAYDFI